MFRVGTMICRSHRCRVDRAQYAYPRGNYYLCGPRAFLRAFVSGLARNGIPLGNIRYEFFGPADELLAA